MNRPPTIATTPRVEALDRPARRLDVGRLRVVDEPHAADVARRLHHVLEAAESAQRLRSWPGARRPRGPRPPRRRSRCPACGGRSARTAVTGTRRSTPTCVVAPPIQPSSTTKPSLIGAGGENHDARWHALRAVHASRPGRRRSAPPSRRRSDWRRCGPWPPYSLHVRVPIEMVVGQVQPQRDPRTEGRGRLELEAADLDDVHRLRRRLLDLRAERHADVAADEHVAPGRLSIRPTSVVVVDFPFVPVTAITRPSPSATPARARR